MPDEEDLISNDNILILTALQDQTDLNTTRNADIVLIKVKLNSIQTELEAQTALLTSILAALEA